MFIRFFKKWLGNEKDILTMDQRRDKLTLWLAVGVTIILVILFSLIILNTFEDQVKSGWDPIYGTSTASLKGTLVIFSALVFFSLSYFGIRQFLIYLNKRK
ncbi:MAG: hypothetical protein KBD53_12460 [Candidatus Omnitrophica bacterium]|nr:hypothetical protein [Candidatus Omnitrophota bacterium]